MRSVEVLIEGSDFAYYMIPRVLTLDIDGRKVNCDFSIEGYSCNTGDYETEMYGISVYVKPAIEECSQTYLDSIASICGTSRSEVTDDCICYSESLPLLYDISWEGDNGLFTEKYDEEFKKVLKKVDELKLLVGFTLDEPVNCSGKTGWDVLKRMI